MDPTTSKRRAVRDFSRRNFVLFYLLLLMVPTLYLLWYLIGTASGNIVAPELKVATAPDSGGQLAVYGHILCKLWESAVKLVPLAIGQYLLGVPGDADQNYVWGSGSLLSIAILSLVEIFDVLLNTELNSSGKTIWALLMIVFSALGLPIPQLIYWVQYMWLEPDRSTPSDTSSSTPVSA